MRAEGLTENAAASRHRSVTVPGCVDGWVQLHERFANLDLATITGSSDPPGGLGFPASPLLIASLNCSTSAAVRFHELVGQATAGRRGCAVPVWRSPFMPSRPEVVAGAFYGGAFGDGLLELGAGHFAEADLALSQADWVGALAAEAFGVELLTIGPASQGTSCSGPPGWPKRRAA